MNIWLNSSKKPLSSSEWLVAHHQEKIPERTKFVLKLLDYKPKKIVDLGCGPGLWLDLFNQYADSECSVCGVDLDEDSVKIASDKAKSWSRHSSFFCIDIEDRVESIPDADIYLAFNIFPYLKNPASFIENISKRKKGKLVIRQYDGSLIRFGPLDVIDRFRIDSSVYNSTFGSNSFKNYELDNVYRAIDESSLKVEDIYFDTFQRHLIAGEDLSDYHKNTISWTLGFASDLLQQQLAVHLNDKARSRYITTTDLVAILDFEG